MEEQWKPFRFYKIHNIPKELCDFFLDRKNYPDLISDLVTESFNLYTTPPDSKGHALSYLSETLHKLLDIPEDIKEYLNSIVPRESLPPNISLDWEAALLEKGHQLLPHIEFEYKTRNSVPKVGIGKFLLWITPDGGYVGRDFVYGHYKCDPNLNGDTTYFHWDDPNLIKDGAIHPVTGDACIFRTEDPHYFHGVTELLSSVPVATISSFIYLE